MTRAALIAVPALVFLLLPLVKDDFILSILTLVFLYAYFGAAWNIMMGLAGQLSLGHGLYVGLGGYTVAVLSIRYGISPWIGIPVGAVFSAAAGAVIGFLGFRFAVRGVYFALLTIAFAEFTRILFDNWSYVGDTGGLFFKVIDATASPLATLRGGTRFFYFASLGLVVVGMVLTTLLMRSRFGYLWRAIRDDEDAARALGVRAFRLKIAAVALSAGLTSVGGSVFALLNGSLFPDSMMGMGLSIQLILAPIIGGLGTVFGPLFGALFVVLLTESSSRLGLALGLGGLNTLTYGLAVLLVIVFMPEGIWPALRKAATHIARRGMAPAVREARDET